MAVTGNRPWGAIPAVVSGLAYTIWECAKCKALISDIDGHEKWHENLIILSKVTESDADAW